MSQAKKCSAELCNRSKEMTFIDCVGFGCNNAIHESCAGVKRGWLSELLLQYYCKDCTDFNKSIMNTLLHLKSDQYKFRDMLEHLDAFLLRQTTVLDRTEKELDACTFDVDAKLAPVIDKLNLLTNAVDSLLDKKDDKKFDLMMDLLTKLTEAVGGFYQTKTEKTFSLPPKPPLIFVTPPQDEIFSIDDDPVPVFILVDEDPVSVLTPTKANAAEQRITKITLRDDGFCMDEEGWQYTILKKTFKNSNVSNPDNNFSKSTHKNKKNRRARRKQMQNDNKNSFETKKNDCTVNINIDNDPETDAKLEHDLPCRTTRKPILHVTKKPVPTPRNLPSLISSDKSKGASISNSHAQTPSKT